MTVTLSSWGCQPSNWYGDDCTTTPGATFSEPITLTIYNAPSAGGYTPGSLITSMTQTFTIPYRPSASAQCTGSQAGEWFDGPQGCFNGEAYNVTFNVGPPRMLPKTFVYGISYNTSDYGSSPYGDTTACHATQEGCPYDSLNVALSEDPQ